MRTATAADAEVYTALGGSNTCGHGLSRTGIAFQHRIIKALRAAHPGRTVALQPSCIPAMGPDYPASCLAYFAPNTTEYATLEFTPNLGEGQTLERNVVYLEQMARTLLAHRVRAVLVSLVPQPPKCRACSEAFLAAHEKVIHLSQRIGVPLVTNIYGTNRSGSEWSDDLKHLNERGHQLVAEAVLDAFLGRRTGEAGMRLTWRRQRDSTPPVDDTPRDGGLGERLPSCVFGADLQPLMLPGSRGFALHWSGKQRDKPGLLATTSGALLRLCLRNLPSAFGVSMALERSDILPMSNLSLGCEFPCSCPLELLSNGDWTLRYRGKGGRRATENYMHRVFGSRRGQAGDGAGHGPAGCDCVITVRNTNRTGDTNTRTKLNGIVAGHNDRSRPLPFEPWTPGPHSLVCLTSCIESRWGSRLGESLPHGTEPVSPVWVTPLVGTIASHVRNSCSHTRQHPRTPP